MICVTLDKLLLLLRFPFCCLENESVKLDSIISKAHSHLVVGIKSVGKLRPIWRAMGRGRQHRDLCTTLITGSVKGFLRKAE